MKHNYTLLGLLAAVALVFAVGCSKSDKDEVLLSQTQIETATEGEKNYLYATIEDEESRTFVVDNRIICWHAGDMISAFCNTTYNSKYTFLGEDGDKGGMFTGTQSGSGNVLDYFYAIYPYNEATMNVDGKITTTLPYLQSYAKDSFGKGANPMVAVATNSAQKLMFNNICGYLKIKLYGNNVKIKSLVLQGNNGEKLSGAATISAPYGEKPTVTMAADATEAVAIRCVNGVTLGTTSEDATTFWFALPPTTFEKGITITAYTTDGLGFTQSTSNTVTITRNRIQPMEAVEVKDLVKASVPSNEIWYTSSNKSIVTPYDINALGATILSNTYEDGLGVITFDRPITSIGKEAFENCTSLTSVTIPDSVTSIGDKAFYNCTSLTSITIPDSVTSIGDKAFYNCTSLEAFYGKFASSDNRCLIVNGELNSFAQAGLTQYTIPDSVTSIGSGVFSNCTSLTSITIGNSVTSIGWWTFSGCTSLTSVTIGNSVTSIGTWAFEDCTSLRRVDISDLSAWCKISFVNSTFYENSYASPLCYGAKLYLNGSELTDITIPSDITDIKACAFYGCTSLTSVTIGNSVTEIGGRAFEDCTSLTSVTIGNSVTSIGDEAFYHCTSLTSITIPDSVTSIGWWTFSGCTSLTSVTIGNSVTSIGDDAFYDCDALTSVTIGNGATSIGGDAFYDCDALKSLTIGNGATSIGDDAFYDCDALTSVTIPDSVTSIGKYTFCNCISLIRVTIGNGVTSIGADAFYECASLKEVYCKPTIPPTGGSRMFSRYYNSNYYPIGCKIYVPAGTESKYKSALYWRDYSSYIYGIIFTDENEPVN